MHEEALLRDLVRKVEEIARSHGSARVGRVRLWVGALAHLSEDQARHRWATLTQGTVAEGSRLEIELSSDLADPHATGVVLRSLDAEEGAPGGEARSRSTGGAAGAGPTLRTTGASRPRERDDPSARK